MDNYEKNLVIELGESLIRDSPDNSIEQLIKTISNEFGILVTEKDIWQYRSSKLLNQEDYDLESKKIQYYGYV